MSRGALPPALVASVLVAAIGNPDRGDDGVGPAVAARLHGRVPAGVRVIERYGDVLALIEEWEGVSQVIVVDAAAPLGQPGRIHRRDLTRRKLPAKFVHTSTHAFGVATAVELARSLGRLPRRLVAYLVEGQRFDAGAPLSAAIADATDRVAERILAELRRISARQAESDADA